MKYNYKEFAEGEITNRKVFMEECQRKDLEGKAECYSSYFSFQKEELEKHFEQNTKIGINKTIKGFNGTIYSHDILIDYEYKDENEKPDLNVTQKDLLLRLERVAQIFEINPITLKIRFSGYKGFHIIFPGELFGGFKAHINLNQIFKNIAIKLFENDPNVDLVIYDKSRLIRIENTINKKSGLYAIPLSYKQLCELTIDQIKDRAKAPVKDPEQRTVDVVSVAKLVQLKDKIYESINEPISNILHGNEAKEKSAKDHSETKYFDTSMWDNIIANCRVMEDIENKGLRGEHINNTERLLLGTIARRFGDQGRNKLHQILAKQGNYSPALTEYQYSFINESDYKPMLCSNFCGSNLCKNISCIGKSSPIAFAKHTHDIKNQASFLSEFFDHYNGRIIYSPKESSFYFYSNGVFKEISDQEMAIKINSYSQVFYKKIAVTDRHIAGLINRMKMSEEICYNEYFNDNIYIINFTNGLYDLRTNKFMHHSTEVKSRYQISCEYNVNAQCPLFDTFIDQIMGSDPDRKEAILQILAYCLIPTYSDQKLFIFFGKGRNGKSVLADVLINLLNKENCASETFSNLAEDKNYSTINLKNKMVNISSELSMNDINTEHIKRLTGGDLLSARDIYKKRELLRSIARQVVLCNNLPRIANLDYAILKRIVIIEFLNSFDSNPDTELSNKLKRESPGIALKLMKKAVELIQHDGSIKLNLPTSVEKNVWKYLPNFNSVAEFVVEQVDNESRHSYMTRLHDVYQAYSLWCRDSAGYKPVGKGKFKEILESVLNYQVRLIPYVKDNDDLYHSAFKNENWILCFHLKESVRRFKMLETSEKPEVPVLPSPTEQADTIDPDPPNTEATDDDDLIFVS